MPKREYVTQQDVKLALNAAITTVTTTEGAIFDTALYNPGVYFTMSAPVYAAGDFALKLEHGDESDLADAVDIPVANLIYGTLPTISAVTNPGDLMPKEGFFSTKRYVRASVVSTNSPDATVNIVAVLNAELIPTKQG